MAEEQKVVKYDLDGFDVLTTALTDLINQYPNIREGEEITFSILDDAGGKAMFPVNGAVIESEKESITGHVTQVCLYPFCVIYRISGADAKRKAYTKEFLDNLGKWLEKQTITIKNNTYKLEEYPVLTGNRKFLTIDRQTPAYLDSINENKSENWAINISARYQNDFDR